MKFRRGISLLAIAGAVVAPAACGSDEDGNGSAQAGSDQATTREQGGGSGGGAADAVRNRPATPAVEELRRQFPPPTLTPDTPRHRRQLAAGRRACRGKTPLEVRNEFMDEAVRNGFDPDSPQGRMTARIGRYQARATNDPSFVAGQLAAGVYEATLPEKYAQPGYQGCVYELALQLERQMLAR